MAVTTINRSEQIRVTSNHNSVAYNDGSGTLTDGSTLTWDATSLGIGTNITLNSSTGAISATSASLSTALPVTSGGTGTTTSTGTGSVVLSNSPTLVTPALGTPSALVLTNATGTPTSIGLTNGTGLPLTTGVTGILPIANGGTNSNTALTNGFVIASNGGKLVENPSSNALSMNGGQLNFVGDPTAAQDAATKNYVDMAVNGLTWKSPVAAATVTILPNSPTYNNGTAGVGATLTAGSNGALVIDGYTVLLNDRILVQNQASAFQNGIYTQTTLGDGSNAYVLTRATDSNTPTELEAGTAVFATNGTTNADKGFLQTTTGTITIGTSNLVYITFTSAVSSYFAGAGLDLTGSTFSISTDNSLTANAANSTPSLVVKEDPAGAISTGGSGIKVNVDNSTIDISSNNIEVKAGGITNTQVSASAAIAFSKLASLTSAHILVGNGSNVATDTAITGDVSITNTGVTSISSGIANHLSNREVPSGAIDGSNTTFTLAHTPAPVGSEMVFLNGILQQSGAGNDYTISGVTITYLSAPQSGDRLLVTYWY